MQLYEKPGLIEPKWSSVALRGKKEEEWWQELKLDEWRRVGPQGPCTSRRGCKCYLGDGAVEGSQEAFTSCFVFF